MCWTDKKGKRVLNNNPGKQDEALSQTRDDGFNFKLKTHGLEDGLEDLKRTGIILGIIFLSFIGLMLLLGLIGFLIYHFCY